MDLNGKKKVVVFGATGTQGGGLITHLLASKDWFITGISRKPDSAKSKTLIERGVNIVQADMSDLKSLENAMEGAYAVFSVQNESDYAGEIEQGNNVIKAAIKCRVDHLIYTASCGAKEGGRGVRYWEAKREIMKTLRSSEIDYTILRPVSFMENYISDLDGLRRGLITGKLTPEKSLQLISGFDIGSYAFNALQNKSKFLKKEIDIASQSINMNRIAETLSKVTKTQIVYKQIHQDFNRDDLEPSDAMSKWYQEFGYDEDIPKLVSKWGIQPLLFEEWLEVVGITDLIKSNI